MFLVEFSSLVFLVFILLVLRVGLYLPAFFILCYMLPFLPLIPGVFSGVAHFWTGDGFSYEIDSQVAYAVSAVWIVSTLGSIFGLLVHRIRLFAPVCRSGVMLDFYCGVNRKVNRIYFIFSLCVFFIVWRLVVGGDAGGDIIYGGEQIICVSLLLLILLASEFRGFVFTVFVGLLCLFYIGAQLLYGDRDFFAIFIALMLLFFARHAYGYMGMLKVSLLGLLIVIFGSIIAVFRMDVDIGFDQLLTYFYYNSWTATIQPVLLMLQSEWDGGPTLYGKSYLDLMLSAIPSFLYSLFDSQKPISVDNPALWFYVEGMGGMHAAGVAWRNFGLPGVFLQCLLAVTLLSKIERSVFHSRSMWGLFFYLVIASQIMHTVWYSLVSMVNAIILFIVIYCLFNFERFFLKLTGQFGKKFLSA